MSSNKTVCLDDVVDARKVKKVGIVTFTLHGTSMLRDGEDVVVHKITREKGLRLFDVPLYLILFFD